MASANARILVLANNPLIRGLLRAYLDHAGHTPLEPESGEPPEQALERLRPALVLVDCDAPDLCADRVLESARSLGARVIVFSASRENDFVQAFARARTLDWFGMPIDRESFLRVLASGGHRPEARTG